jgi:branched-chain amino acid transport system ATP-binding protein
MTSPLLQVADLEVTYNRTAVALHGVSLDLQKGAIVAVLGSNGAGKTTTLRAISGFLASENGAVSGGSITLDGKALVGKRPHDIARLGVSIVPERNKVFATMTVDENLASVPAMRGQPSRKRMLDFVFHLFPPLVNRRSQQAGLLSGGERQMLAVARALMLEPHLLLADELSFGIAPVLLDRLLEAVVEINKSQGVSVLLVEQNAPAAFEIADYIYVLETGQVTLQGTPEELKARSDIQQVYFGIEGVALTGAV